MPISCILKLPLQIKSQIHPSHIQSPQQKTDFNFTVHNKFGNLNWSCHANFNHETSFCFTDRLSPALQSWSLTQNSHLSWTWGGHWGRTQMNREEELRPVANQRTHTNFSSRAFLSFFFCHLTNCRSLTTKVRGRHTHTLRQQSLQFSLSGNPAPGCPVTKRWQLCFGTPLPLTTPFHSYLRIMTSQLQNYFLFHLLLHFFHIINE